MKGRDALPERAERRRTLFESLGLYLFGMLVGAALVLAAQPVAGWLP